jgi:flagellar protein FliS
MYVNNRWKSYSQIATQTASPGQLVLMLFEGALGALERARAGFDCEDPAESITAVHNNIQRAQDIVRELNNSLNMEQGGECAATLRRLYDYFERRLWESNLKKDRSGLQEVGRHLTVLRDAWAAMLRGEGAVAVPAPPSLEVPTAA